MPSFDDFIVFVDESGDHGLESIDPNYPIFVLVFCIFHKEAYASRAAPSVLRFKFSHFGHDQVILHEHDIRKAKGDFNFLLDPRRREPFYTDLNKLIAEADFRLVASVIKKEEYRARYSVPDNPYHIAMGFGLERVSSISMARVVAQGGPTSSANGAVRQRTLSWNWRSAVCAPTMQLDALCRSSRFWCPSSATPPVCKSQI